MSDQINALASLSREELERRYNLALEAIEVADDVMSYCSGDAWEREATEGDRKNFAKIRDELMPPPPPAPVVEPRWATRHQFGTVRCAKCNRKLARIPSAIDNHNRDLHADLTAVARAQLATETLNGAWQV
ncbi:hypothetical protein AB8810_12930 [Xanthomonas sp. NCPPB 3005]|uniref:hypothetical protein n=1 Tax=Xanthomonas sp. NCPPB 3005 TaxID=3240913 RepID=UPI003518635F